MTRARSAYAEVTARIERAEVIQVEMTMIEPFVTSLPTVIAMSAVDGPLS